jgi:threonine dehydratase
VADPEAAPTIEDIRSAASLLDGHIVRTPLVRAPALSEMLGCEIFLKLETQQATGAFKERGAVAKLTRLSSEARRRGLIAMSAGNHAQGVAFHAGHLGIPATIVMPEGTPNFKIDRTQRLGARVVLVGESVEEAAEAARDLASLEDLTFVHPFDDSSVIAGQGTIGLEMLQDDPALDCVVVPVGGGGLISGIATAVKACRPQAEVHGVEASLYPCMAAALGQVEAGPGGSTIADGIAVARPGELTRQIAARHLDRLIQVDEAALEAAVFTLVERQKLVAEGAGAAPLAAVAQDRERYRGRKVGLVVSGGNIDMRILSQVLGRGLARDGRLLSLRIQVDDRPGSLAEVTRVIADMGANIVEIFHHRDFFDVPVRRMQIDIVVETRNREHVTSLVKVLTGHGFVPYILSGRSSDPGGR